MLNGLRDRITHLTPIKSRSTSQYKLFVGQIASQVLTITSKRMIIILLILSKYYYSQNFYRYESVVICQVLNIIKIDIFCFIGWIIKSTQLLFTLTFEILYAKHTYECNISTLITKYIRAIVRKCIGSNQNYSLKITGKVW